MLGLLKDLLVVLALMAALVAAAWFSDPTENYLRTGQNCQEITARLTAKRYRNLTPAEETDMANCD